MCRAKLRRRGESTAWLTCISIAFSPDSKRMLIGSRDATLQVWDVTHRPAGTNLQGTRQEQIAAVAFLSDEQLVSVSQDGTIKLWHSARRRRSECVAAAFDASQRMAFALTADGWASGSLAGPSERAG